MAVIALSSLPLLRKLNVDHNNLEIVPDESCEMGAFPSLQKLSAAGNLLSELSLIPLSKVLAYYNSLSSVSFFLSTSIYSNPSPPTNTTFVSSITFVLSMPDICLHVFPPLSAVSISFLFIHFCLLFSSLLLHKMGSQT